MFIAALAEKQEKEHSNLDETLKTENERSKLDKTFNELLNKKKLLLKREDGTLLVDITGTHRWYLPDKYEKINVLVEIKIGLEEKDKIIITKECVKYENFFNYYIDYRKGGARRTPKKFLELIYEKPKFEERTVVREIRGTIPIKVTEKPTFTISTALIEKKTEESTKNITVGVNINKEVEPFIKVEKGGFFAVLENISHGIKNVSIGITESIFSFGVAISKKTEYVFSATIGPWVGKINPSSGRSSGVFSWVSVNIELIKNIIGRLFEEKYDKKFTTYFGSKSVNEESIIKGNVREKEIIILVKKRNGDIIADEKGNKYKIEENQGYVTVYEKFGFFKKIMYVLNPIQIAKDCIDIVLINPWFKVNNIADAFKKPNKKIDEKDLKNYEKKLENAEKRGNYNTAIHISRLLLNNKELISPKQRAEYMLKLDAAEWKMAHTGLFGIGFGNKKKIVENEIRKRVKENLKILRNARQTKTISPDYETAEFYIKSKADFKTTILGKKVPSSPLPEDLADAVWNEANKHKDEFGFVQLSQQKITPEFINIAPNKNWNETQKKDWNKIMKIMQCVYESKYKEKAEEYYNTLSREAWDQEELKTSFLVGFQNNLREPNNITLRDNFDEIEKLSKEKIIEIFKVGVNVIH